MYRCKICGKEFENGQQLGGHITTNHKVDFTNSQKENRKKKIETTKVCSRCGSEFKIIRYLDKNCVETAYSRERKYCSVKCAHSRKQKEETRRKISESYGRLGPPVNAKVWRCKSCGKAIKRNKTGRCLNCFQKTKEYREMKSKIAKKMKRRPRRVMTKEEMSAKRGGYSKRGMYKNYWCDSSWELAYVIYNLDHNIKFARNTKWFKYVFDGKVYKYYPDFMVDGKYVEIKGYIDSRNEAKLSQFTEDLEVISKKQINIYLKYVKEKYGNDFVGLYEKVKSGVLP